MTETNEANQTGVDWREKADARVRPCCSGGFFEIRVKGHLDSQWSEWLDGLEIRLVENGEMVLRGRIPDQAALMGVLIKLSRLNLALISVNEVSQGNQLQPPNQSTGEVKDAK